MVFAGSYARVAAYAALLADEGVTRGLLGPREVSRLWERHLVNCGLVGRAVDPGSRVCDVGSGAGLPGLVLALDRPDLQVTLLEPMLRRAGFLSEAVDRLGVDNAVVMRARAEELHSSRRFDVVTARAVAPLHRLATLCMPLVRPGGCLLAVKGASVAAELEKASSALAPYGPAGVETHGAGLVDPPVRLVRVWMPSDGSGGRAGRPESHPARD